MGLRPRSSLLLFPLVFLLVDHRNVAQLRRRGGDGYRDLDGEGVRRLLLVTFFSFFRRRPLRYGDDSLSEVVDAFGISSDVSNAYCVAGRFCTNCWRRLIPWLTMLANSPGSFAFLRSLVSSAAFRIFSMSWMLAVSFTWLYLYSSLIFWWGAQISTPHF